MIRRHPRLRLPSCHRIAAHENKAATGEVWFDPIFPKTDGVDAAPHG
jgi:hypothetical protein